MKNGFILPRYISFTMYLSFIGLHTHCMFILNYCLHTVTISRHTDPQVPVPRSTLLLFLLELPN